MVKTQLFFLLSAIAKHSDEGYRAVLAGFDKHKVIKTYCSDSLVIAEVYAMLLYVANETHSSSVQPDNARVK